MIRCSLLHLTPQPPGHCRTASFPSFANNALRQATAIDIVTPNIAMNRRQFLKATAAAGCVFAEPYQRLAAALQKKVKITDVKMHDRPRHMGLEPDQDRDRFRPLRDRRSVLGLGCKDLVLNKLKPIIVGEDPLNVDKLYTKMLMQSAGAGAIAGVTVTAASGIEIALWDLCGRILQTPVCNLLGGRFRDRVRFYRTLQAVENVEDMGAWRAQVAGGPAPKNGAGRRSSSRAMACPPRPIPNSREPGHDPYARNLTHKDYRRIVKGDGDRARNARARTPTSPSNATGGTTRRT